ncbi:MAG TPA: alpha/beta hydrolase-fold protein [Phnomibacter sp.]|nr:alpha/beta hydrolase-fold protein [Phnomibacter sp.]
MPKFLRSLLACSLLLITGLGALPGANAQPTEPAYEKNWLVNGKDSLPYRLLLPQNFNPDSAYPLVLFLHGAGERGKDNEAQLIHGSKLFLNPDWRDRYPAIVVFPQCPKEGYWAPVQFEQDSSGKRIFNFPAEAEPTPPMQMVLKLLQYLDKRFKLKPEQQYVMGLSMGGMGTFDLVRRLPNRFAAAVPICGGANPAIAPIIKNTAFWIFHGDKDDVVPPQCSKVMVDAIQRYYSAAEMQFTLYPGVNHNSWDKAFAEPELLPWLFSQRRKL